MRWCAHATPPHRALLLQHCVPQSPRPAPLRTRSTYRTLRPPRRPLPDHRAPPRRRPRHRRAAAAAAGPRPPTRAPRSSSLLSRRAHNLFSGCWCRCLAASASTYRHVEPIPRHPSRNFAPFMCVFSLLQLQRTWYTRVLRNASVRTETWFLCSCPRAPCPACAFVLKCQQQLPAGAPPTPLP
jgi:hypothetical protein